MEKIRVEIPNRLHHEFSLITHVHDFKKFVESYGPLLDTDHGSQEFVDFLNAAEVMKNGLETLSEFALKPGNKQFSAVKELETYLYENNVVQFKGVQFDLFAKTVKLDPEPVSLLSWMWANALEEFLPDKLMRKCLAPGCNKYFEITDGRSKRRRWCSEAHRSLDRRSWKKVIE